MNKYTAKLIPLLPVGLQYRIMTRMVKTNYAVNDYNKLHRSPTTELDGTQREIICKYLKTLPTVPHILDLGCGNGRLYDTLLDTYGCRITGLDISPRQLAHAKQLLPNQKFIQCDFFKYKAKNKFDGITAFFSLYNIPRRLHKKLLRRCWDWLCDNGRILVNVRVEDVGAAKYWDDWCGAPLMFSYYSADHFKKIAVRAGFYVTQFHATHNPEYVWLILSKTPDLPKFM